VTARQTWPAEKRAEAKVAAQGNKPLGFLPAAALQHPGHRGFQIVVADPSRNASQLSEGADMSFEKRFLALAGERDARGFPRRGQAQHEQMALRGDTGNDRVELAEVDLRLLTGLMGLRHDDLDPGVAVFAPPGPT
jgi:hypothetical protein